MPIETLRDLVYATHQGTPLHLDLHRPTHVSGPLPVIVWLPGGGWRNCRKADGPSYPAEHGFVVASVNYRLAPGAIAPANLHDCKAAVRWLRANAKDYRLDPDRLGVWGISAGGHLATLMALTNATPEIEGSVGVTHASSHVRSACGLCGPSDLTRIAQPELRKRFATLYDVTAGYLGGPVESQTALARLVSPLHHVRGKRAGAIPPMLLAHGDADPVVPIEESLILEDALRHAGADVAMHIVRGGPHNILPAVPQGMVIDFFKRTLAPV